MKISFKFVIALALIAAAVAVCAPSPGASSEHFVIVNNNDRYFPSYGYNYGTVMKLVGPKNNPSLNRAASLATGTMSQDSGGNTPEVQVVKHGSDICVFLADGVDSSGASEVSSFKYPGLTLVGNYSDSNIPPDNYPYAMVASGNYLFAGFDGYVSSWGVGSGCTLSLLQTTRINRGCPDVAAAPNGKAVIASCNGYEDSFSIGAKGALTENGPYLANGAGFGLDITADSQYAIFAAEFPCNQCTTSVMVVEINPDGSLNLGSEKDFGDDGSLGDAWGIYFDRLSPNQKFLYASGGEGSTSQIITLNFSESPLNITYSGCTTNLRLPAGPIGWSLVTAGTTGAGGGLYVAESNNATGGGRVALLRVNASTGCTKEAPASPFSLSDPNAAATSLVAWPPRPF